jgi:hypothetical protein
MNNKFKEKVFEDFPKTKPENKKETPERKPDV